MEITIKLPNVNRAKLIIGFITVFWMLLVKLVYDGMVYIYDGTHQERVVMMTVYDGKKDNSKYIEFSRPNGDIITKRYSRTAASSMKVGTTYVLDIADEKTVYNCIAFVVAMFAHIIGALLGLFGLATAIACAIMWTDDLIHVRRFRTLKQVMKDWNY